MSVTYRGTALNIVQSFWNIDPLTEAPTLADPTTVVFEVEAPDGTITVYTFGVDGNVTHPSLGVYVCALAPPIPTGTWRYLAIGTGAVEATGTETFTVLETGVLAPTDPGIAQFGPCTPWISGDDVAAFDSSLGVGSAHWELDDVASTAAYLAYECSGRQFQGVCTAKVRPCRQPCDCFGLAPSLGLGLWAWASYPLGGGWGWGWQNECGDSCGCGSESYVRLAGYPIRQVTQVKIGGVVLDPSGYQLEARRNLLRMADLTDPANPVDRQWPVCQDLTLPDTEPGTFSISYVWGADPPPLGKMAAAQIAAELWKAIPSNQGECRLPTRAVRIVRSGITIDRAQALSELLRGGSTGLQFWDAFLAAVNPQKARMRSAVWSPDVQPFARQEGQ